MQHVFCKLKFLSLGNTFLASSSFLLKFGLLALEACCVAVCHAGSPSLLLVWITCSQTLFSFSLFALLFHFAKVYSSYSFPRKSAREVNSLSRRKALFYFLI